MHEHAALFTLVKAGKWPDLYRSVIERFLVLQSVMWAMYESNGKDSLL